MTPKTKEDILSRRKALTRIAALALGAYATPAVTTLSVAQASSGSSGSSSSSGTGSSGDSGGSSDKGGSSSCSGPDDSDDGCGAARPAR